MPAIFAPQLFGSVAYYAEMACHDRAVVDTGMRYDKRFKSAHRCTIADTRGPLMLTVPVSKPVGARLWSETRISHHGQWWTTMLTSLESAYGRTPYFEFYIDRFMPWIAPVDMSVTDMDCGLDAVVRRTLGISTEVEYADASVIPANPALDFRSSAFDHIKPVPYYQVRALKLGFLPGLSILDLIFNMGPESPLILKKMTDLSDRNLEKFS